MLWRYEQKCSLCQRVTSEAGIAVPHKFLCNWEGSSGAMESGLALQLVIAVFEEFDGLVYIKHIVTDDDSTMRSHIKNIKNGGKLPDYIPQPIFKADPSHRIKVMCSPIFAMISDTKDPDKCKHNDATRIKRYTGYYIRQNRTKDLDTFVRNAKAPIEHLSNEHSFCDAEWCWSKAMQEEEHKVLEHIMKQQVMT